jgi:AAA domain
VTFQIKDSLSVQFSKAPAIAIAAPSGGGKTESAMRLARGFLGPGKKFLVIDTEEKRALYKKKRYQPWDWMDFQPPFTPERYVEALEVGKDYDAVVLDSGSHEYAGPGGLQDIHEETLQRMTKGNDARAEALSGPAWKDAKQRHKSKFMSYLIRYPKLLIICLRAEPKVKFVKVMKDGRERNEIVDAGYQPICEKSFMFEMLVGCMMVPDEAGIPQHVKRLEMDLEPIFLAGKQIDEGTGERLAAWCADRREPQIDLLSEAELAALVSGIESAPTETLKSIYESACMKANKAKDKAGRTRIIAAYNERKKALEAQPTETTSDAQ